MKTTDAFVGHYSSALFHVCLSTWWLINILRDMYLSKCTGKKYTNQPWYLASFCRRVPLDSIMKLSFSIAFMGTIIVQHPRNLYQYPRQFMHFMMLVGIFLNAICDILKCNHVLLIPDGSETALGIILSIQQAILYYIHTIGRQDIDAFMHHIIAILFLCLALVIYLETNNRHSSILSLVRAYLVLWQGTWYAQTSITLYSRAEDNSSNSSVDIPNVPTMAAIFAVHANVNFLYIVFIGAIVLLYLKHRGLCYSVKQESTLKSDAGNQDAALSSLLPKTTTEVLVN